MIQALLLAGIIWANPTPTIEKETSTRELLYQLAWAHYRDERCSTKLVGSVNYAMVKLELLEKREMRNIALLAGVVNAHDNLSRKLRNFPRSAICGLN
ncbi:hypothetical protein [Aminobacter phage Erebus]|nr:hypothetical protein [Aminobacter phage Erebus]